MVQTGIEPRSSKHTKTMTLTTWPQVQLTYRSLFDCYMSDRAFIWTQHLNSHNYTVTNLCMLSCKYTSTKTFPKNKKDVGLLKGVYTTNEKEWKQVYFVGDSYSRHYIIPSLLQHRTIHSCHRKSNNVGMM